MLKYTERFAKDYLIDENVRSVTVNKTRFNYKAESWDRGRYRLPWVNGDYVILTPKDILTRDDNWINRKDFVDGFEEIPPAIPEELIRAQINNYFYSVLARPDDRDPNKKELGEGAVATIFRFPELVDFYIRLKEQTGEQASDVSARKVLATEFRFIHQLQEFQRVLVEESDFYNTNRDTYNEAHERLAYLKDVIENKGGHRLFYYNGEPLTREKGLQILYRLVWYGTPSDVSAEANDGRGPVDFKISRGRYGKTLIEMKLAKNKKLQQNLKKQVEIYRETSDAEFAIKCIVFFTPEEQQRVFNILSKLNIMSHKEIVLIDARADNKPTGSVA